MAQTAERDHVDRVVELAVAAAVEAVAVGSAGADWDRCAASDSRELRVRGEPIDPGDLADELRPEMIAPIPVSAIRCGAVWLTSA